MANTNGTTLYKAIMSMGNAFAVDNGRFIVTPACEHGLDGFEVYDRETSTVEWHRYGEMDSWLDAMRAATNGGKGKWHVRNGEA